jgi:hypothetical protein
MDISTPRTDAVHDSCAFDDRSDGGYKRLLEHARQLERELAYAQANSFSRTNALITDTLNDRYGRPLVAALHLCLDIEDELRYARQTARPPNEQSALAQENERLRNAIIDVLDRLEPEESADLQGENWQPNLAMSVCSTLREAIGERA